MPGRAEAYRVFFGLGAGWAALSLPLWLWVGLPAHVQGMGSGLVSALIAGYALSACGAWSGRAPLRGRVVVMLAALWVAARLAGFLLAPASEVWGRLLNAAVFAAIAGLVLREWGHGWRAGRRHVVPPLIAAVCMALAIVSLWVQLPLPALYLLPVWLVMLIGNRMLAAFLAANAARAGRDCVKPLWWTGHAALAALAGALLAEAHGTGAIASWLMLTTALLHAGFLLSLSLHHRRGDLLTTMMTLALACLPLGLALMALARLLGTRFLPPVTDTLHLLMIGGIAGTGIAVIARSSARRGATRLIARRSSVAGFGCVMTAALLRMAGLNDLAAVFWSLGWGLVLLGHLRACAGPVPHPIFSASRSDRAIPASPCACGSDPSHSVGQGQQPR